ncbi:MAG: ATP synthase F1 subunit delta [Nitrospirota bacterium]
MQGEVLGRRYAKALFELTKTDPNRTAIAALLSGLGQQLDARGAFADACLNPRYPAEAKRAVLAAAVERAGAGSLAGRFLALLLKKNRLSFLSAIASAYHALLDEEAGRRRMTVTVARSLDQQDQDLLKRKLESITGRTVSLEVAVDPAILGGLIVRSGSLYYDGSLKGQLERLRQQLVAT